MDKITAMRLFTRVVAMGSFSAAAREQDLTQSAVSKGIQQLEQQLGVKLLLRNSRKQALTEAGQAYYDRCLAILEALDEAESMAACQTAAPRGLLRMTCSMDFGRFVLSPLLPEFSQRYPAIQLDIRLANEHLDLIAHGIDLAIRTQEQLQDSQLVARPLLQNQLILVASPAYLQQHGAPQSPEALSTHQCLVYSLAQHPKEWVFYRQGQAFKVTVKADVLCNDGDMLLNLAANDQGIALLPQHLAADYLAEGRLQRLLPDTQTPTLTVNMLYPARQFLPSKTRAMMDFLLSQIGYA